MSSRNWWFTIIILIVLVWTALVLWSSLSNAQDTNPPDLQRWFQSLENRMGGGCCGEGDAYPAIITKMPTSTDETGKPNYHEDGEFCITDASEKKIYAKGVLIKTRPALEGELCHSFSWMEMTHEKFGNPFDHALAFIAPGGNHISRVYCVVLLPGDV